MEEYQPYVPDDINLPNQVHFWKLKDSGEGFNILVYSKNSGDEIFEINFDMALAYKCMDEGDLLSLWKTFTLSGETFIYRVLDSDFIKYFHEQSYNTHDAEDLKHFFIVTTDSCLDVISEYDPEIKLIRSN